MAQATSARTKAFISYSHEDEEYLRELRHHLKFLEQRGLMDVFWADTEIQPGDLWRAQIKEAIASSGGGARGRPSHPAALCHF